MKTSNGRETPGSLSKIFGGTLTFVGLFGMVMGVVAVINVLGAAPPSEAQESDLNLVIGVFVGALLLTVFGVVIQLLARIAIALESDHRRRT